MVGAYFIGESCDVTYDKTLNEIALKVGRLEVMQESNTKAISDMAASVNKLIDKLDASDDIAKEALKSASSAHKRLNMHEKILYWAGTTIVGAVIVGVISYFMRG